MDSVIAVLPTLTHHGYAAVFVIVLLGAAYFPIPTSITLIGGGILSRASLTGSHLDVWLVALVGFLGNCLGDNAGYWIARRFGSAAWKKRFQQRHRTIETIDKYFKKHPARTVLVSRFIGFLSPIVNTLAGFSKLDVKTFVTFDLIGDAGYVALCVGAGYLIGYSSEQILETLAWIAGAFVIASIIYVVSTFIVEQLP